jgi:hypothetical protein
VTASSSPKLLLDAPTQSNLIEPQKFYSENPSTGQISKQMVNISKSPHLQRLPVGRRGTAPGTGAACKTPRVCAAWDDGTAKNPHGDCWALYLHYVPKRPVLKCHDPVTACHDLCHDLTFEKGPFLAACHDVTTCTPPGTPYLIPRRWGGEKPETWLPSHVPVLVSACQRVSVCQAAADL